MPVPSYRVPVKIARGTYANLLANVASLEEGEIVYANDENALYVIEGGVLIKASADISLASLGDLSDVDLTTTPPTDGQALVWNNTNSEWEPGTPVSSIDDLTDVDTTTAAPTTGQVLEWDGSNWVPAGDTFTETIGTLTEYPLAGTDGFYADQAAMEADGFTHIASAVGGDDTAISFTPDAKWNGIDFLGNGIASGGTWSINTNGAVLWDVSGNTESGRTGNSATDSSDIDFYVALWSSDTATRRAGFKEHVESGRNYLVVRMDNKIPYNSSTNGVPTEVWFGEDGSVSVRFGTAIGATIPTSASMGGIWSNGVEIGSSSPWPSFNTSGNYVYHYAKPYNNLSNLVDVDTAGVTDGQVLTYVAANSQWEPATPAPGGVTSIIAGTGISVDQATGDVTITATGGGGGVSGIGVATRASDSGTAASSALTLTGLGSSGQLHTLSTDLDAWVVFYGSAADRTADAGRAYNTDPAAGSGVLAEAYVTTAGAILFTPGTGYMNNDTTETAALYLAVRDQAGAAVNATLTVTAYVQGGYDGVSGGTFGSG
jgi:hypothetical protein